MERIARFEKVSEKLFMQSLDGMTLEAKKHIYESIMLPKRATKGSAGYDFFAPFDIELEAGESITIPTGIRVKIEEGWFLQIFPRSGLGFKFRLQLDNTVGIIDSDYYYSDNEGHMYIKMTNCSLEGKKVCIKEGCGFAQGIFTMYGITYDDDTAILRNGGFGSTTAAEATREQR